MFNPTRYEHVYGAHLIDDLHNYFPEILYDAEAITGSYTVQNPLLSYLQARVHLLFPQEYAQNRTHWSLFRRRQGVQPAPPAVPQQQQQQWRRQQQQQVQPQRVVHHPYGVQQPLQQPQQQQQLPLPQQQPLQQPVATYTFQTDATAGLTSLLASALFGTAGNTTVDIMDILQPVPVIPSRQQLAAASIVSNVEPSRDVTCAICQDHAPPTESNTAWRILRHCGHRFHRACIDQWFRQNVHCPVCRHDIRETPEAEESSSEED